MGLVDELPVTCMGAPAHIRPLRENVPVQPARGRRRQPGQLPESVRVFPAQVEERRAADRPGQLCRFAVRWHCSSFRSSYRRSVVPTLSFKSGTRRDFLSVASAHLAII